MANESPLASNIGSLTSLLSLFLPRESTQTASDSGSVTTTTGGGQVSGSSSQSGGYGYEQTILTQEAVNRLLQQIMESNTGLTSIAQGQKNAGLYNSSTMQLLINDLMARAAGEVAVKGAKTEKVTPVSTSSSSSRPSGEPQVVTRTGSPATVTSKQNALLGGGGAGSALGLGAILAIGSDLLKGDKGTLAKTGKKLYNLIMGIDPGAAWNSSIDKQSWVSILGNSGPALTNYLSSLGLAAEIGPTGAISSLVPSSGTDYLNLNLSSDIFSPASSVKFDPFGVTSAASDAGLLDLSNSLDGDVLSYLGGGDVLSNLVNGGGFAFVDAGDALDSSALFDMGDTLDNVDGVGDISDLTDTSWFDDVSIAGEGADAAGSLLGDYSFGVPLGALGSLASGDAHQAIASVALNAIPVVGNALYFADNLTGHTITDLLDDFTDDYVPFGRDVMDFVENDIFDDLLGIDDDCFITTAVCGVMGYADNCHVLSTLRRFRDTWLTDNHPDEISTYYTTAPSIVEKLGKMVDKEALYGMFYTKYLLPAVRFIEHGEYEAAYETYKRLYQLTVDLTKEA